jgi:hypothetical protein
MDSSRKIEPSSPSLLPPRGDGFGFGYHCEDGFLVMHNQVVEASATLEA